MKKLYRYLLMTVLALCLSIPAIAAEAASVAVLPLINKVEGRTDVEQVYYSGAINAIKAQSGFMMVDNDELTAVVEKHVTKGVLPNEATLKAIAAEAKVDIVIAMELDTLDYSVSRNFEESRVTLDLQGYCVSYNAIDGKFVKHRIYDDSHTEETSMARWDWPLEQWGRNVKREVNRALKVKKITIEAPRMTKL